MNKRILVDLISNCKVCNSPTEELVDKQMKVTYDVCHNCDFISKQESYHLSEEEEHGRYSLHNNFPDNEGYVNIFNNMIDIHVRPLKDVKTILDFGCGPYPTLKILLERLDYKVSIYDPYFETNLEYRNQKYNLITTTEVIEHMVDPIKELEHMLELLEDKGYLLIMTLFREMDQERFLTWWYRRDKTHISFFNETTFKYLQNKFNLIEVSNNNKNIVVFQKK